MGSVWTIGSCHSGSIGNETGLEFIDEVFQYLCDDNGNVVMKTFADDLCLENATYSSINAMEYKPVPLDTIWNFECSRDICDVEEFCNATKTMGYYSSECIVVEDCAVNDRVHSIVAVMTTILVLWSFQGIPLGPCRPTPGPPGTQ